MLRDFERIKFENDINEEEVRMFLEKLMQVDTLRKQRYRDWKIALFPSRDITWWVKFYQKCILMFIMWWFLEYVH